MRREWKRLVYDGCIALTIGMLLSLLICKCWPSTGVPFDGEHPQPIVPPVMGLSVQSILNNGNQEELDALPGVGEVIAQRIIETRELLGGFLLAEDLMLVKGIGEKTRDKIMEALDETYIPLTD